MSNALQMPDQSAAPAPGDDRGTLRAQLVEHARSACVARFGRDMRAMVLTGSAARCEETFRRKGSFLILEGDAEFLLVFPNRSSLPSREQLAETAGELAASLATQGIQAKFDLSPVLPKYFRRLPAHIFSYELRECGQVIWGDQSVLRLIPAFTAAEIECEDAWRLLCNRLIELLELLPARAPRSAAESAAFSPANGMAAPELLYRIVKLYLDMATSFLVFAGRYEPTYRGRNEVLGQIAADRQFAGGDGREPGAGIYPFPLAPFAAIVAACAERKLRSGIADGEAHPEAAAELNPWIAVEFARQLWRWELAQLLRLGQAELTSATDQQLLEKWMRRQPLRKRIRGWLYVTRAQGWLRSAREWPRWARMCAKSSPRYWIYRAMAASVFDPSAANLKVSEDALPWIPRELRPAASRQIPDHRGLAQATAWNYHAFLTGTRA